MSQSIVAVTDRAELLRLRDRHPALGITVFGMRDLSQVAPRAEDLVVIDVDLKDPDKIQPLKRHTALASAATRLVVVDPGARAQVIQAKGLGATDIVPRPLIEQHLLRVCFTAAPRAPKASDPINDAAAIAAVERASIQAGADLLVSLFAAREPGTLVDMAAVNNVGNQVVAAVASVGLDRWLTTVRHHHAGTFQHCLLVTGVAASFGRFLGLAQADLRLLTATALLHDIGKAAIPLHILNKPARLTPDEFAVMKRHPVIGYEMLVSQPGITEPTLRGVRHHHEYLDGSGYPDGLVASEIEDIVRMMTVVDIYGALIEKRAYKKPRTPAEAMATLRDLAEGGKTDRALTAAMGAMVSA